MAPGQLGLVAVYIVVAGLAGYRWARFLAVDALIKGWRDGLKKKAFTGGDMDAEPLPVIVDGRVDVPRTVLRYKAVYLLFCGFCNGWWITGLSLFVATRWAGIEVPWPVDLLHWSAAAGVQSLAIRWDTTRLDGPVEVKDVTKETAS